MKTVKVGLCKTNINVLWTDVECGVSRNFLKSLYLLDLLIVFLNIVVVSRYDMRSGQNLEGTRSYSKYEKGEANVTYRFRAAVKAKTPLANQVLDLLILRSQLQMYLV